MAILKGLVATFVMPLPFALLLTVIGLAALGRGYRRAGLGSVITGALVVFLASWGPVADGLLGPLERQHPPVVAVSDNSQTRAVVVLGGGWYPEAPWPVTSQINDSAVVRLMEGIRLYRAVPGARLIATGGNRRGGDPAAWGYAQAAMQLGVPEGDIVTLDTPEDTAQEAAAVRDLLGAGEGFYLVTSASHMYRAVRHFHTVGLEPTPAPTRHKTARETPDRLGYWVPKAQHLRKTERALYEYMGLLSQSLDH